MIIRSKTRVGTMVADWLNPCIKSTLKNTYPVGTAIMWPTGTPPDGYLECDGSAISRTTYSNLFTVISDDYGNGDGSTTFNLPDTRGKFTRGWANSSTNDPDRASRTNRGDSTTGDHVGTNQSHEMTSHTHTANATIVAGAGPGASSPGSSGTITSGYYGGNETRPININVMICIKY